MLKTRARDYAVAVVYNNLIGGQDELVFDGLSLIVGPTGDIVARGPAFEEALIVADLDVEAIRGIRRYNSDPDPGRAARRGDPSAGLHALDLAGRTDAPRCRPSPPPAPPGERGRGVPRARARHAGLRPEERLPGRRRGPERRRRLVARGVRRGRRARRRRGPRRHDVVRVHLRGQPPIRRRRSPEALGIRALDLPIDAIVNGVRSRAPRRVRRPAAPTSPRRTCRRGPAGISSWRSRTSSAGSC